MPTPKKPRKLPGPQVHVVLYGHKHGTDCWVASSHELALASIKRTILDYIGDLEDSVVREMIKELLKGGEVIRAATMWSEVTDESFEINPRTMDA
jgi:hypothetical protein